LGSPKKRREASFMRMLKKDVLGEEERKEAMENEGNTAILDEVKGIMGKDNVLNFIKETKHGFRVMKKALGC
jgi:hypothetical protein